MQGWEKDSVDAQRNEPHSTAANGSVENSRATERVTCRVLSQLDGAIECGRAQLLTRQRADGHWCGDLEGAAHLESQYVLLMAWLGQLDRPTIAAAARSIAKRQRPQGGWSRFPSGELDSNISVAAYFALKLCGYDPAGREMRLAREAILAHGGADRVDGLTRYYVALLGQLSYAHCPPIVPELALLPQWCPVSLHRISAWARQLFVPLAVVWAHRPRRTLTAEQSIDELFVRAPTSWPKSVGSPLPRSEQGLLTGITARLFHAVVERCDRWHILPLRKKALATCERWMRNRFVDSDGLGANFQSIVWSIVALKCLGYAEDTAELCYGREQLEQLVTGAGNDDALRLQPSRTPVADTAWSLRAVAALGEMGDDAVVVRAVGWLAERHVCRVGDWQGRVRSMPGGWCAEYHNAFYPSVPVTAAALATLAEHLSIPNDAAERQADNRIGRSVSDSMTAARRQAWQIGQAMEACQHARQWVLAMQNQDGGWGVFDGQRRFHEVPDLPLRDRFLMCDQSYPDTTGQVLEALVLWGAEPDDIALRRGIEFLRAAQFGDGSWSGSFGINATYGTWHAMAGLRAAGVPRDDAAIQSGVHWLIDHQHTSGGWGESPDSLTDPKQRGRGPITPTQTAWALLGLLVGCPVDTPELERGVAYLLAAQRDDGSWDDPDYTGVVLGGSELVRNDLWPTCFPMLALGRYQHAVRHVWSS